MHSDLLISCARIVCGTGDKAGLEDALARVTSWDDAVEEAKRENLSAVVYRVLQRAGLLDQAPEQAVLALKTDYWNSQAGSLSIERELARVVQMLGQSGVQPLVLKGAAMANAIYDDPAMRMMSDVDLVVRRQDFQAACSAMASDGSYQLRADMNAVYRELTHAVFCRTSGSRITFEIHQSLLGDIVLPKEDVVWGQAVPHPSGALALCTEDMLVHLCVHAALRHQLRSLSQLLDIGLVVIKRPELDWELVKSRAVKFGVAKAVAEALDMMEQMLAVSAPADVVQDLRAAKESRLRELALAMVADPSERHSLRMLGRWFLMPGFKMKAKYARWNLLPSADWLETMTGKKRSAVYPYYIVRAFRAGIALVKFLGRKITRPTQGGAQ